MRVDDVFLSALFNKKNYVCPMTKCHSVQVIIPGIFFVIAVFKPSEQNSVSREFIIFITSMESAIAKISIPRRNGIII